eukprot:PhM_4_TR3012/c1_g4_i2/m.89475
MTSLIQTSGHLCASSAVHCPRPPWLSAEKRTSVYCRRTATSGPAIHATAQCAATSTTPWPGSTIDRRPSCTYSTTPTHPTSSTDTYDAKGFDVAVIDPVATAGCSLDADVTATPTISKTATTTPSLALSGVATVAVYRTLLRTVSFTCGSASVASLRVFDFEWGLVPNLLSRRDDTTFEPHYYEYVATAQSQSSAVATCAAKTMFGLKGYLLVVDSAGENN